MQMAICGATQSQIKYDGTSDTDVQKSPSQRFLLYTNSEWPLQLWNNLTNQVSVDNAKFVSHKQKTTRQVGIPLFLWKKL